MNGRPHIESVAPRAAIVGGELQIRGTGFCADSQNRAQVRFGGLEASLLVSSNRHLIARVPEGAVSCDVVVGQGDLASNSCAVEIGVAIADNMHPVANPAIDLSGNIFVTVSGPRGQKVPVSIYKIDPNYSVKPFSSDVMNPTGMAFDRENTLYISSRHDGNIYKAAPNGTVTVYAEGMGIATGIAFDETGFLYVGDRSGTIFKIAPDRQIFVFATLEPSISAYHLAFGPDSYLYVTGPTTSSYDCIYRISKAGDVEKFYRGLGRPQGMAFDVRGNLYVAASQSGRKGIFRITPEGDSELVVSGVGLVGLALTNGPAAFLASNQTIYHLSWDVRGRSLIS